MCVWERNTNILFSSSYHVCVFFSAIYMIQTKTKGRTICLATWFTAQNINPWSLFPFLLLFLLFFHPSFWASFHNISIINFHVCLHVHHNLQLLIFKNPSKNIWVTSIIIIVFICSSSCVRVRVHVHVRVCIHQTSLLKFVIFALKIQERWCLVMDFHHRLLHSPPSSTIQSQTLTLTLILPFQANESVIKPEIQVTKTSLWIHFVNQFWLSVYILAKIRIK